MSVTKALAEVGDALREVGEQKIFSRTSYEEANLARDLLFRDVWSLGWPECNGIVNEMNSLSLRMDTTFPYGGSF